MLVHIIVVFFSVFLIKKNFAIQVWAVTEKIQSFQAVATISESFCADGIGGTGQEARVFESIYHWPVA